MMSGDLPVAHTRAVFETTGAGVDRDALTDLHLEYLQWVADGVRDHFDVADVELFGAPLADCARREVDALCATPREGAFHVARVDGQLAGMGGLRAVAPGVTEIKRVYVRPQFRGRHVAEGIVARLLADAAASGCRRVVLDTAPFMYAAHRLYERFAFVERGPYEGTGIPPRLRPHWRFMERHL